jgi:hypothetical protein
LGTLATTATALDVERLSWATGDYCIDLKSPANCAPDGMLALQVGFNDKLEISDNGFG